jgi:hypothetical protein
MLWLPNGHWMHLPPQMNHNSVPEGLQHTVQELQGCGFQALGTDTTQGSKGGLKGSPEGNIRALSADGSTWLDVTVAGSGWRGSLRRWWGTGMLRGVGDAAQCTTELNDHSFLVTTTAQHETRPGAQCECLPPGTSLHQLVQRHLQRLEQTLLQNHPLKVLTHSSAGDIEVALRRARLRRQQPAQRPLSPEGLRQLGVAPHLARLIAGDSAVTAEPVRI